MRERLRTQHSNTTSHDVSLAAGLAVGLAVDHHEPARRMKYYRCILRFSFHACVSVCSVESYLKFIHSWDSIHEMDDLGL